MFVNFASNVRQILTNSFQIRLILEGKFGDDLLSNFSHWNKFKVSLLQEEATEIERIDFVDVTQLD